MAENGGLAPEKLHASGGRSVTRIQLPGSIVLGFCR